MSPSRRTLRQRRMAVRGINSRLARLWGNRVFLSPGIGNRASLTTSLAGANNDLAIYAKTPGTGSTAAPGNAITFRIVVAGVNTPLSVSVAGNAITVNSATNGSSVATSTAADVRRAVNFDVTANKLVHVQYAPGNDGTGVVTALAATNLAGAV